MKKTLYAMAAMLVAAMALTGPATAQPMPQPGTPLSVVALSESKASPAVLVAPAAAVDVAVVEKRSDGEGFAKRQGKEPGSFEKTIHRLAKPGYGGSDPFVLGRMSRMGLL